MKKHLLVVALLALLASPVFSAGLPATVRSPDEHIVLRIAQNDAGHVTYSIERKGDPVFAASALRVQLAEGDVSSVDVRQVWPRSVNQVRKLVATKASEARDQFNELTVDAMPRSRAVRAMQVRVPRVRRRRGVSLSAAGGCGCATFSVKSEDTEFTFGADYDCTGLNIGRVDSSHEGEFDPIQASRIREHHNYDLPLVCRTAKNAFAIGEADLRDYGGMYLTGRGDGKPGVLSRISRRLDDRVADRARGGRRERRGLAVARDHAGR